MPAINVPKGFLRSRLLSHDAASSFMILGFIMASTLRSVFAGWHYALYYGWYNVGVAIILHAPFHLILLFCLCEITCALPFTSGFLVSSKKGFGTPYFGAVVGLLQIISHACIASFSFISIDFMISTLVNIDEGKRLAISICVWTLVTLVAIYVHYRPKAFFVSVFFLAILSCATLSTYIGIRFVCIMRDPIPTKDVDSINIFCQTHVLTPNQESSSLFSNKMGTNFVSKIYSSQISETEHTPAPMNKNIVPVPGASINGEQRGLNFVNIIHSSNFVLWLFQGFEAFKFVAEEAPRLRKILPQSLLYSVTLFFFFVLAISAAMSSAGDSIDLSVAPQPVVHFISRSPNSPNFIRAITAISVVAPLFAGILVSLFVISRIIYAMSRAGVLSHCLSKTTWTGSPLRALFAGGAVMLSVAISYVAYATLAISFDVARAIIRLGVISGLMAQSIEYASYLSLAIRMRTLPRPFVSPLGATGAALGAVVAILLITISTINSTWNQNQVLLVLAGLVLFFSIYYALFSRKRLEKCHDKLFIRRHIRNLFAEGEIQRRHVERLTEAPHPRRQINRPRARLNAQRQSQARPQRTQIILPNGNIRTARLPAHSESTTPAEMSLSTTIIVTLTVSNTSLAVANSVAAASRFMLNEENPGT